MEGRLASIQRRYDAGYRAQMDQVRVERDLMAIQAQGLIGMQRRMELLSMAAERHGLATAAINRESQALMAMNASAGMARAQTANLGYQIQDIGTMLAMGQNPFMLLAQQLPQITQNGGKLDGVMGALKNTISSLFSPLGLLTTGFVLAASAAIGYFSEADDEADDAAKALEEQADLIQRVADKWGEAIPALREYADEMDRAADSADLAKGVQELANRAWEQARAVLPDLKTQLGSVVAEMLRVGPSSAGADELRDAFNEADRAAQDLRKAIADNNAEADDFERVTNALATLLGNDAVKGSKALTDSIDDLREAYGAAADEAVRLGQASANALATAAAQAANLGRIDKTGQRLGGGANPIGDNEFNSRFGWGEVFDFPKERKGRKTRKSDEERARENYADMIRDSQQFIAAQKLEAEALFMTEEAAAALRYEQEMLNQAANDNIKLTPEMTAEIKAYAEQMAKAEAETNALREAMDFAQDLTRSFIDDLRSGLESGEGFWDSLANAALNALDRIASKLMDGTLDALFENLFSSKSGGGGFLSGLFSWLFNANGNAFSHGSVIPFANGGVVSQPTIFPMAKGAGLMGEAGPEAIMPLRRGPDGRLGVSANGGSGSSQSVHVSVGVTVDDDGKIQAYVAKVDQRAEERLAQYDKGTPGRIAAYQSAPRRRSA